MAVGIFAYAKNPSKSEITLIDTKFRRIKEPSAIKYGTRFLLSGIAQNYFLIAILNSIKNYRLSVKVRVITSRCCSGVKELKRTA